MSFDKSLCKGPKQILYVEYRIAGYPKREAAKQAGYAKKSAHNAAMRLEQHQNIQQAINQGLSHQQYRIRYEADDVVREMCRIAFSDFRQAFDENGDLKPLNEMPEEVAKAIQSVKISVHEEGQVQVKDIRFWDKTKSLEQLGRHFALFTDNMRHTGPDGGPIQHEHGIKRGDPVERMFKELAKEDGLEPIEGEDENE